jgi:hypothetical protein
MIRRVLVDVELLTHQCSPLQIFAALNPYDLLRLGRATKALRSVVMSRSARSVWMRSFKNIDGLPSCPDGMTEPAWAHLAFEPVCDVCCAYIVRLVSGTDSSLRSVVPQV